MFAGVLSTMVFQLLPLFVVYSIFTLVTVSIPDRLNELSGVSSVTSIISISLPSTLITSFLPLFLTGIAVGMVMLQVIFCCDPTCQFSPPLGDVNVIVG
jgi:hypothetical protein